MSKKKKNSSGCFGTLFGLVLLACIAALIIDLITTYVPKKVFKFIFITIIVIIIITVIALINAHTDFIPRIIKKLKKPDKGSENNITENNISSNQEFTIESVAALPEYTMIHNYLHSKLSATFFELMSVFPNIPKETFKKVLTVLIHKNIVKQSGETFIYISDIAVILDSIDRMSSHGLDFEEFTVRLLRSNGFSKVRKTQGSGDYGVDVLAEKDGVSYAIQCKCYSDKVGNKAVQEAFSGKSFYNCMVAAVLTNNYFTRAAEETAKANNVLLWDRNKLIEFLTTYQSNKNRDENIEHEKTINTFSSKLKEISYNILSVLNDNGIYCKVKDIYPQNDGLLYELYLDNVNSESNICDFTDEISNIIQSPNTYVKSSDDPTISKIFIEYPESLKLLYNKLQET